jgi:P-type Ca2+ transporter type 2C
MTYLGGEILSTRGLVLNEWMVVVILSLGIIPVNMIRKAITK